MSNPRVLLTTYHDAFLVKGGGEHEMFSVADTLKQYGIIADIYGPYSRSLENYDAIIHFSVHGGGLQFLENISLSNKPIILWPNVWFKEGHSIASDIVSRYIDLANVVLFKSNSERQNFLEHFPSASSKSKLVLAGANGTYKQPSSGTLFKAFSGLDNYAIWFGIIEPAKNQKQVISAFANKNMRLVLVGNCRDSEYLEECIEEGKGLVHIIHSLPYNSELVRSALAGAEFYVEVGSEPPGLSAIEAGLTGCKMLLGDSSWTREHFAFNTVFVDPESVIDIEDGIDQIKEIEGSNELVESLSKFCLPESLESLVSVIRDITR